MNGSSISGKLHLDTGLARALATLFQELEQKLQLRQPVNVYLAGGEGIASRAR